MLHHRCDTESIDNANAKQNKSPVMSFIQKIVSSFRVGLK